jgi:hypothetical protein
MTLEKTCRFLFGLFGFSGQIKGHKAVVRKQAPESGGLACLARAGEHQDRTGARGTAQSGLDAPLYPHCQNIRWNRIFSNTELLVQSSRKISKTLEQAFRRWFLGEPPSAKGGLRADVVSMKNLDLPSKQRA